MDQPNPESRSTFAEHLSELRRYLIICIVSVIGLGLVAHLFYPTITRIIFAPLGGEKATFLSPLDPITFVLKIDLAVGVILSLPIILWCMMRFAAPAISRNAMRVLILILTSCTALILVAVIYSYYLVIPLTMHFLATIVVPGTVYQITAQNYLSFVITQTLIAVLIFQTPLILVALTYIGLVNPHAITKKRPLAYIVATIACSVLTPTTDLFSLSLVLIPTLAAFEVGALVSKLVYNKRHQ